ncbi:hypothetical protein P3S67_015397 [Capsicum chacoense]
MGLAERGRTDERERSPTHYKRIHNKIVSKIHLDLFELEDGEKPQITCQWNGRRQCSWFIHELLIQLKNMPESDCLLPIFLSAPSSLYVSDRRDSNSIIRVFGNSRGLMETIPDICNKTLSTTV